MKNTFYGGLGEITKSHLIANSINTDLASGIVKSIINDVTEKFGGNLIYLKNGTQQQLADKHSQIISEFNGTNHSELMTKYRISKPWLIKLIKRQVPDEKTIN